MTGIEYRAGRLKLLAARAMGSSLVGYTAAKILRDKITSRGVTFDTRDPMVTSQTKARLLTGLYESAEIKMVLNHMKGVHSVVDLGASLGFNSVYAMSVMNSRGSLLAVEADPSLIPSLTKRLETHRTEQNTVIVNAAIASFDVVHLEPGSTTVAGRVGDSGVGVRGERLSALLGRHQVRDGFALLSDIEGSEHEMISLDGAALERCGVAVLELHEGPSGESPESALAALGKLGFRCIESRGPVVAMAGPRWTSRIP